MKYQPGTVLQGKYQIIELIGQGGYGVVYKAYAMHLSVPVALKHNLDRSPIAQEQFQREAKLLAKLRHPNLPRVTDHFIVGTGEQCLVMDYIKGENLAKLVERRGKLPPREVLRYAYEVCDALIYLHAQTPPIIHRDIKPANIIITNEGQAMLVDFGIFKWYDPHGETSRGARGVTPGYSPPEQYSLGQTDGRSDIYALGATLYALLSGQNPPDSLELYFKKTSLTSLRVLNSKVSEPLARVIESAMALRPEQRPQSVGKFRRRLEDAEGQLPRPASPPRSSAAAPVSPPRPSPATPAPQQAAQPGRAPLITPAPPRLSGLPGPAAARPAEPQPAAPPMRGTILKYGLAALLVFLAVALGLWGLALWLSRDATTLPLPPRAVVVPDNVVALTKFRPWENGVVNQIAYSPDGRKLAVASSYSVSLFEAESLEYVDKHWVEQAA
ncbi:MAG: protein kinase, partial [Candidatus Promineofilum sp.]|nr:protein kinase [Promineifilum sp.]